ncbi:hypothetical protein E4U22_003015 [Claviceps purpurea]|uniref:Cyanovirin-N domain-containing protein n=1 Tax=Claviceps purpurea (strain 20.1) TaxID=1111077 RepID=M1W3C6_CLAP2|nr:hypothetical protein E4U38_006006 [Claviceps purpurea]CCE32606.1 uncharacterized protein CPUR_06468 [Claviceps purpurea 20.1]KAG6155703.1 hypothetical protein E4U11_005977 [Claviceps purpurea]KAG6169188.1 hypothetical protein E4U51_001680 [Claviceps purpurea]KAG6183124.1 hypothetical protein E4U36_002850 [Claviceps purpurea]
MKLLSTLPLAFLAGHALAQCDWGRIGESTNWEDLDILGSCKLNKDNVYYCGDSGTTVVHKQSQFMLRAGKVDSTVAVICANHVNLLFHCSAGDSERFVVPDCNGNILSINSVRELPA